MPVAAADRPAGRARHFRAICGGEGLVRLKKLRDRSVRFVYIGLPFNSDRNDEVFRGETEERWAVEQRHPAS